MSQIFITQGAVYFMMTSIEIIKYKGEKPRRRRATDLINSDVELWKWVKVIEEEKPSYDANTQRLEREKKLEGDSLIISYKIVDLTPTEIQAKIDANTPKEMTAQEFLKRLADDYNVKLI